MIGALYYPRHRRKDLAVALAGVNIGVLAVTTALSSSTAVSAGLGLGLFGVLSIIRLRSTELSQVEVAYYFSSLSIGLICGLGSELPRLTALGLVVTIVLVMAVVDSSLVMRRSRHLLITVDRALADHQDLSDYIHATTGLQVAELSIVKLDYVGDSTLVDVRALAPSSKALASSSKKSKAVV